MKYKIFASNLRLDKRVPSFTATAFCLFTMPITAHAGGIISSLASTAAHTAAASAAGTGAAMATAHAMEQHQDKVDAEDTGVASVCGKMLVTHSVAKQVAPLVGQSASHIVVQVSNESVDPDGTRQCTGTVTFPGGKHDVSWTAQKHGLLYKVAATLIDDPVTGQTHMHKVTL